MDISVIITAYNKGPYIKDCLLGVLNQDFDGEMEIIVADDCSTDHTKEAIHSLSFHHNFNKVKYTRHNTNKGLMGNFIWAISQAIGEYIALCDGDDVWSDIFKTHKQLDILNKNIALVGCGSKLTLIDTREYKLNYADLHFVYEDSKVINEEDFLNGVKYPFGTSTFVFKRDKLNIKDLMKFQFALSYNDFILYNLLANEGQIYKLKEETVVRNHNKQGITANDNVNELPLMLTKYWILTKLILMLKLDYKNKVQLNTIRDLTKIKLITKLNNRRFFLLFNLVFYQKPHFTFLDRIRIISHFYPKLIIKKLR
jgi:glycosyltransferase involved in cell wall biosynthesis